MSAIMPLQLHKFQTGLYIISKINSASFKITLLMTFVLCKSNDHIRHGYDWNDFSFKLVYFHFPSFVNSDKQLSYNWNFMSLGKKTASDQPWFLYSRFEFRNRATSSSLIRFPFINKIGSNFFGCPTSSSVLLKSVETE